MPTPRPTRIALLGATLTGNRGAESMLRAAVQRIPELVPGTDFTLLSLVPADDAAENRDPQLRIAPFTPAHMLALALPLALLAGALARLGLPHRFLLATRALRAIDDADLVVDLSGISFVDGRGPILVYNVLVVLLPALLRTPLLKYSQALGPFHEPLNAWCARRLLPRTAAIAARGRISRAHLAELDLRATRVVTCADAAFAMRIDDRARERVAPLRTQPGFQRPVVCVSASSVVHGLCEKRGIDYPHQLAAFIRWLIDERDYGVCLLAHSARPGHRSPRNNDLPVCDTIHRIVGREACIFPQESYDAQALRALIGECRFLVASRFHAMVSGLATGVPTALVGWSHKYREVLADFELEDYAIDHASLSEGALRELFARLERDEAEIRERIRRHLPGVMESSLGNARLAAELLVPAAEGSGP
jgi:polysaccharide pyruvyl transferase WcaK-like protein